MVQLASDLDDKVREQISDIFVEGFYRWLKFFTKDKAKMKRAFLHIFNLDVFYVALVDGEVAGFVACTGGKIPAVRLRWSETRRHLGLIRGTLAYLILKKEFTDKPYPFPVPADMGLIEFVATSPRHRRQGAARAMISRILATTHYREYALEVADTNTPAVQLYESMGFKEFMRVPEKHREQSGIDNYLYMKCEVPRS